MSSRCRQEESKRRVQLFRCWSGCTMQNSGSNSKASTNQPVHCSPMKARNFFGVNRSLKPNKRRWMSFFWRKEREKKGTLVCRRREWTRAFSPRWKRKRKKRKKSPKGERSKTFTLGHVAIG